MLCQLDDELLRGEKKLHHCQEEKEKPKLKRKLFNKQQILVIDVGGNFLSLNSNAFFTLKIVCSSYNGLAVLTAQNIFCFTYD